MAQLIFSIVTKLSFKNVNICLLLFKLINLIIHILNCYLIYKITKKLKFVIIYGLNPFILLEFMGIVHNDIIVAFLILFAIYFLIKKKKLLPSVIILALATGIKYFTIMLLPIFILYHFKDEKSLIKRLLRCIEYGIIFLVIILLQYAIYYRDISIFTAMMAQNKKFSKSIYSGMIGLGALNKTQEINIFGKQMLIGELSVTLRNIMLAIFVISYIKFCIDLLTSKKIYFYKSLRKYSFILILFLLSLATVQQWYLIWLFTTIFWQKSKTAINIIGVSLATEIANSIYMFKVESFKYDMYFWAIIIFLSIIWALSNNLYRKSKEKDDLKIKT